MDAIVCEMEHFHTDALLPYIQSCKTKQLLFHHYNAPWSLSEITALRDSQTLPYPIQILQDTDHIYLIG